MEWQRNSGDLLGRPGSAIPKPDTDAADQNAHDSLSIERLETKNGVSSEDLFGKSVRRSSKGLGATSEVVLNR